jgi:arginase
VKGRCAILETPSVLGLFPRGVERLPAALLDAGLADAIGARQAGSVAPPLYDPTRDPETGLLNPTGLRDYAVRSADAIGALLVDGDLPVVLGGDCSILLGTQLALRRKGRYGLLFLDGHADYYQPSAEPEGQAASMDLALVTGRGPAAVTDLEGRAPLVREGDVVHLGRRDQEEADEAGSQRIEDSGITVVDLDAVRDQGALDALERELPRLVDPELEGFWVHLDCDVLDDTVMPAVDYRLPGGLTWGELAAVLRRARETERMAGIEVTIYNPSLDPDGAAGRTLVDTLVAALTDRRAAPSRADHRSAIRGSYSSRWAHGTERVVGTRAPPTPNLSGDPMYYVLGTLIFALLAIVVVVAFFKQRSERGHFDD